jgi:hypothetical protein
MYIVVTGGLQQAHAVFDARVCFSKDSRGFKAAKRTVCDSLAYHVYKVYIGSSPIKGCYRSPH